MADILQTLKGKAKQLQKRIVFPEVEDDRTLKACAILRKEKILIPVLVGDPVYVAKRAQELGINLTGIEIHDPKNFPGYDAMAQMLYELRKEKGLSLVEAHQWLQEPIYLGTMLVQLGKADGLVSGAVHPTAHTLRPALQIIKTNDDTDRASSYFVMIRKSEIYLFADCGMNVNPTAEQLAKIAISTADTAKMYGVTPKVALLSFSTKGSGKDALADKVVEGTRIAKKLRPDLILDGELQFDAAFVPSVAQLKCPDSMIKGDANVFIFPDINAGNIGYKLVERLGGFMALGPIVQGLKKPVNDLSRGCSVNDIVYVGAITAVIAGTDQRS
jgi:phosphate acetyltransferase